MEKLRIGVLDYGLGNSGSVLNIIKRVGGVVTNIVRPEELIQCSKIVLPGVGAFDKGISLLQQAGMIPALEEAKDRGAHILGICLGLQLLCKSSEEGRLPGLGWIDGVVKKFPSMPNLRVPNMGWRGIRALQPHPLIDGLSSEDRFYFVHSYYALVNDPKQALCETTYGIAYHSGVCNGNVYGLQFHPEKSLKYGMKVMKNFVELQ